MLGPRGAACKSWNYPCLDIITKGSNVGQCRVVRPPVTKDYNAHRWTAERHSAAGSSPLAITRVGAAAGRKRREKTVPLPRPRRDTQHWGKMDDKLILAVFNHPELYNVTLPNYRCTESRINAWRSISTVLGLPCEYLIVFLFNTTLLTVIISLAYVILND